MSLQSLPIDEVLPSLIDTLRKQNCLVLKAPPGAGKTTRVPPAILDAGICREGKIVLLQPRRLAARAAAARMSAERGTTLGDAIGYQVRFEKRTGPATRIISMTEGVFVRRLQDDPFFEGIGVVIFDEFHERSLDADVVLAMVRRVQMEVRPDLKLLVMSATLAAEPIAQYLGNCPTLESAGRTFPVDVRYLKHTRAEPLPAAAASSVEGLLAETTGDVLVFLPGVGEIRRTADLLSGKCDRAAVSIMPLYADLPLEEQQKVLAPSKQRKVVLATNVAETSITIDGVTAVVDTGMARVNRFDPALGLNRLELVRISQASANQRAGRAGRTQPGLCVRLWTEREQHGLAEQESPEILRVDLAGAVLELMCWGEKDARQFPWFQSPPAHSLEQAESLLKRLGAIDERGVTKRGQAMARLPVHPRLARMLLEGETLGCVERTALVAAMLSERDPFRRHQTRGTRAAVHRSASDVVDRALALEEFASHGHEESELGQLDAGAARSVLRIRDQLLRMMKEPTRSDRAPEDALLQAIFAGFPDRLARRRAGDRARAVMLGGRGVKLAETSAVDAELFVCVELQDLGQAESLVRQASAVDRNWLSADRLTTCVEVSFDAKRERVAAFRRVRYEDLILEESPAAVPNDDATAQLLASEAVARLDLNSLLSADARSWLSRWQLLAQWMPELALPVPNDNPLQEILPQLCDGRVSFEELQKAPLLSLLKNQLLPHQLAAIEREAPEKITVPSGSAIALQYEPGKPPVLAVRIQELFGMQKTPTIAGGKVPVLLHLLAPNYRPQQVTTDLASFWKNTYPIVRGELRRRYPKHAWPEDPYTATAEHRPRRRS